MGRGDSNILFHPVKIVTAKTSAHSRPFLLIEEERRRENPLLSLAVRGQDVSFLEERNEGVVLTGRALRGYQPGVLRERFIDFPLSDAYTFLEEGLLWTHGDELYLQNTQGDRRTYPWNFPGEAIDFYLTEDDIYALFRENDGQGDLSPFAYPSLYLVSRGKYSSGKKDDVWKERLKIPSEEVFRLERRDEISVLLFQNKSVLGKERFSLLSLRSDGAGEVFSMDEKMQALLASEIHDRRRRKELLLTPGVEDGQYYYLDLSEGKSELHFADLSRGVNQVKSELNNLGITKEELFRARAENRLRLRSSAETVFLWIKGSERDDQDRLLYFAFDGSAEKFDIPGKYQEMAVSEEQIILWTPGKLAYRTILLPSDDQDALKINK